MNILFLHRGFPAQFKHIAKELAKDPLNNITFITNQKKFDIEGVTKVVYEAVGELPANCHPYLKIFEDSVIHGRSAAKAALELKNKGYMPDIIYGHHWGVTMFMKDIFPNVPVLSYSEWFYNAQGADLGFAGNPLNEDERAKIRTDNAMFLTDLYSADALICPTQWQKSQFPKEFQDKITVIHDGVDTDSCKPDEFAQLKINDELTLTAQDEVITYATRGMEPYRGFPEFMIAINELQKKHPKAHFVIAGDDATYYGTKIEGGSYKNVLLSRLNLDMKRTHFVNTLAFEEYVKLLQISSVHVYATYPFILSWSCLDAMATGCCIVASNTAPVTEFIKDNYNGILFDFHNINQLIEKVEYALGHQKEMEKLRQNARKTIVDNYALKDLLPKHIEFLKSLVRK